MQPFISYTKAATNPCSLVSLFLQVSLKETRTGSFSKESRCSGARNKFIILPVWLLFQQNILNTSTYQTKTRLKTPFFPEQLPVPAFDGNSQLRCSGGKRCPQK